MMAARSTAGLLVWHVERSICTVQPNLVSRLGLPANDARNECDANAITARIHPEDRDRAVAASYDSFASGNPYVMTFRMYDGTGAIVLVHQTGWWLSDPDGRPQSLAISTSISDHPSMVADAAFIQANSLIGQIRRLAINEGWRNVQHLADVLGYSLEMTMQNVRDAEDAPMRPTKS